MIEYIPYKQFGDFSFSNSVEEITNKIKRQFKRVSFGNSKELTKEFPSIYIQDIDVYIVFQESGDSIRYIETSIELVLENCNLQKETISGIKNRFSRLDQSLEIDQEGSLTSKKFGFKVTSDEETKKNSILIFNKDYLDEKTPSPDDIIKFYLGR